MRDPARITRMLTLLGQYWREHPDLRLGQIVGNLAGHDSHGHPTDPYYFEDNLLEHRLRAMMVMPEETP